MSRLPTDSEDEEKMELLFRHPDSHPPPPLPSVQRLPIIKILIKIPIMEEINQEEMLVYIFLIIC